MASSKPVPPRIRRPAERAPHRRAGLHDDARVWAVLGPTNTGKTHLAIERMLGHETGMIGLPLRLLAREVYDKVAARAGAGQVALVTGEEKIVPRATRYWVTTVEAMPVSVPVDFLAVDEVQLAADPERGHVFTQRVMHARGMLETLFLGADTARNRLRDLVPGCRFEQRPRFSELSYTGQKKITRLPRRSAVVAFSAERVYAIAELIRRQRGGAAVVMGALSPRTRNAQVALYQSGDVDFIVATDAIGMGLNMDVDHVAFAAREKFDGLHHRPLTTAEMGQIAGRAGRYMNDGTFGVTGEAPPLEAEEIEEIEDHRFEPLRVFMWRNDDLDFGSIPALMESLDTAPPGRGLARPRMAADMAALTLMARDERVIRTATSADAVRLLWEVAQVPDFRKVMIDEHATLLANIYDHLMQAPGGAPGVIPDDWFLAHLRRTDRTDGDIDALATRLAHVRTWTYVANRANWLADPAYWQGVTRAIEDRLSDALHERLTQRFIDRRTSVLLKRLRQSEDLMAAVSQDGEVTVEGEFVGRLQGLVFVPDPRAEGLEGKALRAASDKAVAGEIEARAAALAAAADAAISLTEHGRLMWQDAAVGRLVAGADRLSPPVEIVAGEELDATARQAVAARLETWTRAHVAKVFEPLLKLRDAEDVTGLARGIAFRLIEALGSIRRDEASDDIQALAQPDRAQLRKYGVRFGAFSIFMPALLKPAPAHLALLLHAVHAARGAAGELPAPPAPGLTSATAEPGVPDFFYPALGFRVCGPRAVRLDMLERLADAIRPKIAARASLGEGYGGAGFVADADLMSLVGCSGEEFEGLLKALGFRPQTVRVKRLPAPAAAPADTTQTRAGTPEAPATPPDPGPGQGPDQSPDQSSEIPAEAEAEAEAEAGPEAVAPELQKAETPDAETPAGDALATETPADTPADAPADAPSPEAELEEIVLWRPARRGRPPAARGSGSGKNDAGPKEAGEHKQTRPRGKRRGKPRGKTDSKAGDTDRGKPATARERPPMQARPPHRKEKPIDPDSPFAILSKLKDGGTS